jgi:antitoxin HicB
MAQDALESAMDFYFEDNRTVPMPSPIKAGDYAITLPTSMAAKILLLNEMIAQRVSASELARRMNTTRQEACRVTDLHHTTKIDRIAQAAQALGRELEVSFAS